MDEANNDTRGRAKCLATEKAEIWRPNVINNKLVYRSSSIHISRHSLLCSKSLGVGPSVLLLENADLELETKMNVIDHLPSIYPDTLVSLGLYPFFLPLIQLCARHFMRVRIPSNSTVAMRRKLTASIGF